MADQSWLTDLLDEDIPVIDRAGQTRQLKDLAAAPSAPIAKQAEPAAAPPPPAPVVEKPPVEEKTPPAPPASPAVKPPTVIKPESEAESDDATLLAGVTAAVGSVLGDEASQRHFVTAARLYFRDLRDALETKSKFTMPVASGGLGLSDEQAEKVMAFLVAKEGAKRTGEETKSKLDKQRFVAEQTEKIDRQMVEEETKEQQKLDEMFGRLTAKVTVTAKPTKHAPAAVVEPAPPRLSLPPRVIQVVAVEKPAPKAAEKKEMPPSPAPAETKKPVAPAPTPSIRQEASAPVLQPVIPAATPAAKPILYKEEAAVAPKPAPAVPPPPPTVAPPPPVAKPTPLMSPTSAAKSVMTDVKAAPKLVGPIEELRSLTVKDFRRLSRDPHEATLKIRDKIDLLEDQSFEARTAGVKAWQESGINKLYLEILRQSLEGRPISELMAEREAKGELILEKAEFDAIMELNRKLRFG
ncbi:MAG: hypothetical protein PHT12_04230 [Patescibacteria group bacterium]|nr:hypothetical protein [Patescibacteria group bacterium]